MLAELDTPVLAAQVAADAGLAAPRCGALEPAQAQQVAVLGAEAAPAVHLGACGHLAPGPYMSPLFSST